MLSSKGNRFINIFVLVMIIMVTLPCSVKREFKSILDIPISTENTEFQKTKTSCSTDIQNQHPTNQSEKEVDYRPNSIKTWTSKLTLELHAANPVPLHYSYYTNSTVRLHQLIEQYII